MIYNYLKLIRVSHWIKNLFVFVPLIFSKHLFEFDYSYYVTLAFIAFCICSGIIYIFNDIFDIEYDKFHPAKKYRPLPSEKISIKNAIILMFILSIVIIPILLNLSLKFFVVIFAYFIINIFYTLFLKKIVIVDIITIAIGFMLRVLGGAAVVNIYISKWLILSTIFISLFLAVMKRRSELVSNNNEIITRKVLENYSIDFINQVGAIVAAGVIICYSLYSVDARTKVYFGTENLVYTTLFVIFGIFRYMYLVYLKQKGESSIEMIFKDIPLLISVALYIISVVAIIYGKFNLNIFN
ncbi:MAG: decaprenyl-phosphate phosphoribosyltransferase [Ignavibacteriales bacterium]|nr:decaprenyl-phosphate phosphoribosyltransferase [Ignavibacteriales bacterium]